MDLDLDAIQRVWAAQDDRLAIDSLCGIYMPCVDYFTLSDMVTALGEDYTLSSVGPILSRLISKGIIKPCDMGQRLVSSQQKYILTDEVRLYYHF